MNWYVGDIHFIGGGCPINAIRTCLRNSANALRIRACLLISLGFFGSACSVSENDYHYIEIDDGQFRVLNHGKPSKEETHAEFSSVKDMPVRYSLSRESYTVWAKVPFKDANAFLEFSAESDNGETLLLSGEVEDRCFGTVSESQGWSPSSALATQTVAYGWFRKDGPECEARSPPLDEPLVFNLSIYSAEGLFLADEQITLKVRKNGRVRLVTGL